ncbi:MAG: hypothetical protein M1819_005014 [Sarea resinae]|nr:MAG: hypothetical protein M1819_005014 [Sarea resinae]
MSEVQSYLLAISRDGKDVKDGKSGKRSGKEEAHEIARETAKRLESKELAVISIVQELGPYLTDDDPTIRANATAYLSDVIATLPSRFFTLQQTKTLATWYCSRLEDGPRVESAIRGLIELFRAGKVDQTLAQDTLLKLAGESERVPRFSQGERFLVYTFIDQLMSSHRQALKSLGDQSLVGITDIASGEKDPRNLMIVFSVLKVIMVEWDISNYTETLFDSVFCYFPITFRPPPDDPYGITAQDLKDRLRECIASTTRFAPYAFPALIDKLDSTSTNVKRDVLQTITACANSYSISTISNYSVTLWDSLKFEVLNMQEEDLAEETLIALRAILTRLTSGPAPASQKLSNQYLGPVLKECNRELQEPQQRQAKPSGRILAFLATASPMAFDMIVKATVPPLLLLYENAPSIAEQRALLEILVEILDSAAIVFGTWGSSAPHANLSDPFDEIRERLLGLFSRALMSSPQEEVSFRISAVQALLALASIKGLLQQNEIGMIIQHLDEVVLTEDLSGRQNLHEEAVKALVQLSKYKPVLIQDITIPNFMAKLPMKAEDGQAHLFIPTLEGLAQLSVEKSIFDTIQRRLLFKLTEIFENKSSTEYAQAILATLGYIFRRPDLSSDPNLLSYYDIVVVNMTRDAVLSARSESSSIRHNEAILEAHGQLANYIVRALDEDKQKEVATQIWKLYASVEAFEPIIFSKGRSDPERRTMIISTYFLAALDRKHPPTYDNPTEDQTFSPLLDELVRLTQVEHISPIRTAMLRQLALLTNKFLPPTSTHLASSLTTTSLSPSAPVPSILIAFALLKALTYRMDPSLSPLLQKTITLLSSPAPAGPLLARAFSTLLAPDPLISRENHALLRPLHKQKLFNSCIQPLSTAFRSAPADTKPNYLIALAGILKYVPSEVILPELETLLPLLLQSLDLKDAGVRAATLETVAVVVVLSSSGIEEHVKSFISRLLGCTSLAKENPPTVRAPALRTLRLFPQHLRTEVLLPYKRSTMQRMLSALDDPKRAVRKEAVDCVAMWARMDEPDDDD